MSSNTFQFHFTSSKNRNEIFSWLTDPKNWWTGLFSEIIKGNSEVVNDEFSFSAGDGMHYSNQKLVELIPGEKIMWQVTESNLSFLKNTNEWAGTRISFNIAQEGDKTKITFTHDGLVPQIECYDSCSSAWTKYMENIQLHLK